MNVIAIEELAKVIANKHHLTQQEADAFINAFFKNIRNALATEKLVKIKGLGTFAVAVMKSTEYPGRKCKVMTFSPEPKLSKQINKPFAQFEVVTLAEGVTFDDVTEETGDDSLVKTVAKEEISVDDLPMVGGVIAVILQVVWTTAVGGVAFHDGTVNQKYKVFDKLGFQIVGVTPLPCRDFHSNTTSGLHTQRLIDSN